jgi:hypothetical protein
MPQCNDDGRVGLWTRAQLIRMNETILSCGGCGPRTAAATTPPAAIGIPARAQMQGCPPGAQNDIPHGRHTRRSRQDRQARSISKPTGGPRGVSRSQRLPGLAPDLENLSAAICRARSPADAGRFTRNTGNSFCEVESQISGNAVIWSRSRYDSLGARSMSAFAGTGHACRIGLGSFVPKADVSSCSKMHRNCSHPAPVSRRHSLLDHLIGARQ